MRYILALILLVIAFLSIADESKSDSANKQLLLDQIRNKTKIKVGEGDLMLNLGQMLNSGGSSGTRGGGSGILIFNEEKISIQEVKLLEIWRSQNDNIGLEGFTIDDSLLDDRKFQGRTVEIRSEYIFLNVLNRIINKLPVLALKIQDAQNKIGQWIDSYETLPIIFDYGNDLKLNDHEMQVQIVHRILDNILYDKYLYDKMNAINRAALKMHEYVYTISNHKKSSLIQKFVVMAFSKEFETMSDEEIMDIVSKTFGLKYLIKDALKNSIELPEGATFNQPLNLKKNKKFLAKIFKKNFCGILTGHDYTNQSINVRWKASKKSQTIKLSRKAWKQYYKVLKNVRAFLKAKYPEFLYPTFFWSQAEICLNRTRNGARIIKTIIELKYKSHNNDIIRKRANARVRQFEYKYKLEQIEREMRSLKKDRSSIDLSTRMKANLRLAELASKRAKKSAWAIRETAETKVIAFPMIYQVKTLEFITVFFE